MLSTQTQLLRLSQGQLNLLERCPRQFQHIYLEQLYSPTDLEREEHQTLGSRFHLLMQQREMGLPIDSFLQTDAQLQSWMTAFTNAAPDFITPISNSQTFRESEHYRTLQVQNYLLTVVYDLLIADHQQAQIFDWKTYPKLPNKRKLEQNWQTRLYMYVLAETSDYLPENISMTYWFVQSEGKPQNIKFSYNYHQHEKIAKKLKQLLSKLTSWLKDYQQEKDFPQVSDDSKACEYCQFAKRCNRTYTNLAQTPEVNSPLQDLDTNLMNIASIQEVSL
jgi:hypothetical protein